MKKEKKKSTGFGLRLSFAIILLVMAAGCSLPLILVPISVGGNSSNNDFFLMDLVLGGMCALMALAGILQCVAAVKGKTKNWANSLSIVIGSLFIWVYFLGILAIVGGVRGKRALKASSAPSEQRLQTAETDVIQPDEENLQKSETVTAGYQATTDAQSEKQEIKRSDFKLDLYDANIDEKTWKDFKKTATQEELAVIAIGAKYRISHSRILNVFYALGIILSIAIFWPTGGWSLIGYPVFAFLATKSIRYEDTFSQSYRKLSKENKSFVDGYYNNNAGLVILDAIIKFAIFWLTIPYQAILLFIGTFAPNFVISKNGILVSIPNGYDVGNLGAVGAYYSGFSFIDEALANTKHYSSDSPAVSPTDEYYKDDKYTYTDSHGYEQTVYSSDGKYFYDVGGHCVGNALDEKTVKISDKVYKLKKED